MPRYWLAFLPGLTIAAVARCRGRLPHPAALPGSAQQSRGGRRRAGGQVRHDGTTFHPNSGNLPYEVVDNLPVGQQVFTDGRTCASCPCTAATSPWTSATSRARIARPESGQYVLIFSDTR